MYEQFNPFTPRTAKPVVAGIFNIVIGSFCVLGALIIGLGVLVFFPVTNGYMMGSAPIYTGFRVALIAVLIIALGVISIVGGIYSLQRRMWGWALVGSIAATLISTVFGIVSIILTAISRDEFTH